MSSFETITTVVEIGKDYRNQLLANMKKYNGHEVELELASISRLFRRFFRDFRRTLC